MASSEKIHTHYDNLKVARNAPPELIKAAYRLLAQKYHPDKWQGPGDSSRVMALINESYSILIDEGLKAEHDEWIRSEENKLRSSQAQDAEVHQQNSSPAPPSDQPPSGQPFAVNEPPVNPAKKKSDAWGFWLSIVVATVVFKLVGVIGGAIALACFHLLKSKIGRLGAATTALVSALFVAPLFSSYLSLNRESSPTVLQAAPVATQQAQATPPLTSEAPWESYQIKTQPQPQTDENLDRHYQAIYAAHPDAKNIVASSDFNSWVSRQPVHLSKAYKGYLENGSTNEIISMFSTYKASLKATKQAANVVTNQEANEWQQRQTQLKVDMKVATDRAIANYPYLNTPAGAYAMERIIEKRDELIRKGVYPSLALTQAVNAFADAYDPR